MSNLIDERNDRTKKRKRAKRKMDRMIGLSYLDKDKSVMNLNVASLSENWQANEVGTIRLLDEGFFDQGFWIKKGTLKKFLNGKNEYIRGYEMTEDGSWKATDVLNLTDDFVGTVNLGHMEFATFPFIIGEWTREDLSLVDMGNGRRGLNVSVKLDEDSIFVKELKRQPYDIGISSEFYYHINDNDTEKLSETLGYYMPVIDEVYIFAYGLVGECGNVNSSGLELKGEIQMENKKQLLEDLEKENLEEVAEVLETEELELAEEEVEIPQTVEETATEEAESEEIKEEPEAEAEETEDNESAEEEVEEEEAEEESESEEAVIEEAYDAEAESEEDDDDEAEESDEEELAIVTELREQIQTLTNKVTELAEANAKLKKTNRKLSSKYQNELDKKEKFKESLKGLSVELLPDEDKKPKEEKTVTIDRSYYRGDGIGEI